jgi:nitrogenase molybdenum-iron protein alpha chain
MSPDYQNDGSFHEKLIEEVLSAYPDKFAKRRRKHLSVAKPAKDAAEVAEGGGTVTECEVKSNIKSIPGVMTVRGCAYAGSKGVVWGPIKDMVHISHGPVGCGHYSWAQRRNYYTGTTGIDSFVTMQFTSDFQDRDIVFGGDKKLAKIIDEIETLFPLSRGITVQSECPIGLIGDDIEAVAKKKAKETGKTIVPVRCEGFRGVSQSLGHHIANDAIRDWVLDKKDVAFEAGPYDVNVIGDYNIGGDAWASRLLLEEIGLRVIGNWSGDATLAEIEHAPKAKAQPHPLLPVDELYLPAHGGEARRRLDGVQLLRPDADCGLAAQDREALRPRDRRDGRAGHRQVSAAGGCDRRQVPAASAGQDCDALCRRLAPASRHHRLRGSRDGDRRRRL